MTGMAMLTTLLVKVDMNEKMEMAVKIHQILGWLLLINMRIFHL
ncbi:hypothetical protein HMPREF9103_00455 [Lentilactobacillus parafarraginis F0439]|uniref:Uncharacterized protein n=1 Tax=Lentilactobacillus parafarraginis F0439 TaxID=797515 RepID=G9ZL56_9LACO|nr:hypothetical protein HMPREF9103_00455 [Lentilactobacillus parafarraginis F0439]